MKKIHRIDEGDEVAVQNAVSEIVECVRYNPVLFKGIQETYNFKKRYNPDMKGFDDWLRDVWATQVFQEVNRYCGGYSLEKAKRIADIEYLGTPFLRKVKEEHPEIGVGAYVSEGTVNVRLDVPVSRLSDRSEEDLATNIEEQLIQAGYDGVEVVLDYDDEVIPVIGTRKFV